MAQPPQDQWPPYLAIIGLSALLCFALLLTASFWLTLAIMLLGGLHAARYFPEAEAFIAADPLLLGLRRFSPLILLGIVAIVAFTQWLR